MEPDVMNDLRHKADTGISRVSLRDAKIVVPFVLTTTLCAVAGRMYLKLRHGRKLDVDDYFLLAGTICFVAATGLYYGMMDSLYIGLLLGTDPQLIALLTAEQLMDLFIRQLKMHAVFHFLISSSIFGVKLGFLFFFGKVVEMMGCARLYWFWKITIWITVVFSIYFMFIPFIACPTFGPAAVTKCQGSFMSWKLDFLTYLGFATDCFSDLLIVTIPVLVLRKAKAQLRQKITVAIFLSLSLVMIFVAVVRVATMRTSSGVFDYTWMSLWLYIEAGVAIIMVSLAAFRAQFILRKEEREWQKRLNKPATTFRPSKRQAPWLESRDTEEIPTTSPAMPKPCKGKPCKGKPGLSIILKEPESIYTDSSGSNPFITSPSWIQTSHSTGPEAAV